MAENKELRILQFQMIINVQYHFGMVHQLLFTKKVKK